MVAMALASTVHARPAVRLYVDAPGAPSRLRDEVVQLLRKNPAIELVAVPQQAERIVALAGETHIRGYQGRNIRLRYVNADSYPVFTGYLSVELKTPDEQPVWSSLATAKRPGPEDEVDRSLASQIVKRLVDYLATAEGAKP